MKLTALLLTVSFLNVSAKGISQNVTFSAERVPLQFVLSSVEKQTGFVFVYFGSVLDNARPVTIHVTDVPLEKFLAELFKPQPLVFEFKGKNILISRKVTSADQQQKLNGTFDLFKDSLIAVKGRIVSDQGPVNGATVSIKNSNEGTVTDADGYFNLSEVNKNAVLVISGANIETREEHLSGRKELTIAVRIKISRLDEIKFIGYGVTTQRYSTGNETVVKSEVIERQPVTNPLQALEGRVAGLQIMQGSGLPGSPVGVQIRGQNSIAASNNPLYIVDGVPFTSNPVEILGGANGDGSTVFGSPMNSIDPADIESITILKDADATAIYGSRGSNGVILIITKKGRPGKTHLDLNVNSGFGTVTRMAKMWNTKQYLSVRNDAFVNDGITPSVSNAPDLTLWSPTTYFDWQKWYMGNTASSFNGTATLSGGSGQLSYLLSGTYHYESTVLPGNASYKRGNFHLNLNQGSANQRFNLSVGIFYTTDNNFLNGNYNGALSYIITGVPNYPVYDSAGKFNWVGGQENYVADLLAYSKSKTDNLNAGLTIRYEILKGLNIELNGGFNKIAIDQITPTPSTAQDPIYDPTGSDKFGTNTIHTYVVEPQLNYSNSLFGGKWKLLAGATYQQNTSNSMFMIKGGYTDDLLIESMNYGNTYYIAANTTQYKYVSLYSRLSYNLKNKYLLSVNFRRDGSSRFGPNKQFGNFWSVGSAWIFSNEKYLKNNLPWLSAGKLRASFGVTGNDGIGDYGYVSTYTNTSMYGSTNALVPSAQTANPDFQWEVNRKFEVALELGFSNDRILFTTSFYRNRSGNQLVNYALPSITGSTGYTANLPALVQNKGWECELTAAILKTKTADWKLSANLTIPNNKLIDFPGLAASSYANTYVIGSPLNIVQAYHFLGVDPNTGSAIVQDINKDGNYTSTSSYNQQGGDFIIAGKLAPAWYGGFENAFRYKAFHLNIFFQYVSQQGYNLFKLYGNTGKMANGWDVYLPYWKKTGDLNVHPAPSTTYTLPLSYYTYSDATISGASFLRLKNVSLTYDFAGSWINHLKISGLQIYIQLQNMFTFTNYKGYDPENASNSNLVVPPLKMLTAGIKCSL